MLIDKFDKIIHQIWWSGNIEDEEGLEWYEVALPGRITKQEQKTFLDYQKTYKDFCKQNTEWKYIFWNKESILDLVKQEFPKQYDNFCAMEKVIKKCDCARYMLLYVFGGMYADIDTVLLKPVDDFLNLKKVDFYYSNYDFRDSCYVRGNYDIVIGEEPFLHVPIYQKHGFLLRKANNGVIFSRKGVDFWMQMINNGILNSSEHVFNCFGPDCLTKALLLDGVNDKTKTLVLPEYYLQYPQEHKDKKYHKCQYTLHKLAGIWYRGDAI